jgi:hypothetical protein
MAETLESAGFRVVRSAEFDRLWGAFVGATGAVFDPVTGKVDEQRFEVVEEYVYRELGGPARVGALLYPGIQLVELFEQHDQADFCGTWGDLYCRYPRPGSSRRWSGRRASTSSSMTPRRSSCTPSAMVSK